MSIHPHNESQNTLLPSTVISFALIVAMLVVVQLTASTPAPAVAPSNPAPQKVDPALLARNGNAGKLTVRVLLTRTTLVSDLPKAAAELLTTTKGSTAARLAAQRNPAAKNPAEEVAASIAEASRNKAIPMIGKAARGGVLQSSRIQAQISQLGGRVISASPLPNQILAQIPASAIAKLAASPDVASIGPAAIPKLMNAPIDGSPVWQANGFTGQGSSADGNGSPDVVVFDNGIRVSHDAFKTRLPGDCSTCMGSGPTRVISPTVRTDFSGDKHANTIAAEIAATDQSYYGHTGMAYGIDKLYDNRGSYNPYLWDLGISAPRPVTNPNTDPATDIGLAGTDDLPEVINYSAGVYQDTIGYNAGWTTYFDALESSFGILNTVASGNCGIANYNYEACGDGPHRVTTPGNGFNILSVGGFSTSTTYPDTSGYANWAQGSPGPTFDGRKKPDLVAYPNGTAGTPSAIDDHAYAGGLFAGTSFAAPQAAAGALLLASTGVYLPTAQKALMINTTTPIQGQTYWNPLTGWGALNLETTFYQRGNYINGSVSGAGPNSARFFSVSSSNPADRTTLVWNRRTSVDSITNPTSTDILFTSYLPLTNLDLAQISPADPTGATVTSTGGSDAADNVDTNQTVSAANPMPGNGSDGEDNVEQIRSTASGSQILKVKAQSAVAGATSEPFSLASADPITALSTPIPNVSSQVSDALVGPGQNVTITATITNPSADLGLSSAAATLTLPAGASLVSGANPQTLGTIGASGSAVASWTVKTSVGAANVFTATASGTTYGEQFAGSDSPTYNVDAAAPDVTVDPQPEFSANPAPSFCWSATDAQSNVASFDAQSQIDGGPWTDVVNAGPATSATIAAADNQLITTRVRARDSFGNLSSWHEVSTTVDSSPPSIVFGAPTFPLRSQIVVPVSIVNSGAPIASQTYVFNTTGTGTQAPLGGSAKFFNGGSSAATAKLVVSATDALGRSASRAQTYTVPPAQASPALSLFRPRLRGTNVHIRGAIASKYTGRLTISVDRRSKTGTRKLRRNVRPRNGRFAAKLALRPGNYRIRVRATGTASHRAQSKIRHVTVR